MKTAANPPPETLSPEGDSTPSPASLAPDAALGPSATSDGAVASARADARENIPAADPTSAKPTAPVRDAAPSINLVSAKLAALESAFAELRVALGISAAPPDGDDLTTIRECACVYFGVSLEDLISSSRRERVAVPRMAGIFAATNLTAHSPEAIGHAFRRNHTTVLYARRAIRDRMDVDPQFRQRIQRLEELAKERLAKRPSGFA